MMGAPPLIAEKTAPTMQENAGPVIVFEHVSLAFDQKIALDNISFQLDRGETKAIFGVAGSGKSTILKLSMGLLKPDGGRVHVLGTDITDMSEEDLFAIRRKIGMVFQESALFDSLTVRENVAFRLLEEGDVSRADIEKRVHEVLSFVELEKTVDLFPSELSGGMRRRVAIARAIVNKPELLLYDSPTGGLDPVTSNTIIELIVKQRDVSKTSALFVTHRLQDAFTMATYGFDKKTNHMQPLPPEARANVPMCFLLLRDGKIIFNGDAHELAQSKDEYIREYIS
jgi:phospholipid/cholesterol/gamma-HCH transport system ATP-binding protein